MRSAAFCLGAMQALDAELHLLKGPDHAQFLSAVSGGAYAGAAFMQSAGGALNEPGALFPTGLPPEGDALPPTEDGHPKPPILHPPKPGRWPMTWLHRDLAEAVIWQYEHSHDRDQVLWKTVQPDDPLAPGSPETLYLRRNAQYMKAEGGIILALATLLLRMMFNLLYLTAVCWIAGSSAGLVFAIAGTRIGSDGSPGFPDPSGSDLLVMSASALVFVFLMTGGLTKLQQQQDRESLLFLSRWEAWLRDAVVWVVLAVGLLVALPGVVNAVTGGDFRPDEWLPGAWRDPVVALSGSAIVAVGGILRGAQAAGMARSTLALRLRAGTRYALRKLVTLTAWLVYPTMVMGVAALGWFGTVALFSESIETDWRFYIGMVGFLSALFVTQSPQAWSLHEPYARRLNRFFGVLRQEADGQKRANSRPVQLSPMMSSLSSVPQVPEFLVCCAVNVTDPGATAAGSNVRSLVFSPSEVRLYGDDEVFSFPTRELELALDNRGRARFGQMEALLAVAGPYHTEQFQGRIAECVAISGAAVSPAMGRMTRGAYRSLLSALNIRLGQWLPNPASQGMRQSVKEHAERADQVDSKLLRIRPRLVYYFREAIGLHPLTAKLIYATDGGHYENLGLVELLRRNCSVIWCVDASADLPGTYATLSSALLLAESELGVRVISLDTTPFELDEDATTRGAPVIRSVFAKGRLRYRGGEECELRIVRIGVDPSTPGHLTMMRRRYPKYPYDGTWNQLYNAERFDAYRELGYNSTLRAIRAFASGSEPARTRAQRRQRGVVDLRDGVPSGAGR